MSLGDSTDTLVYWDMVNKYLLVVSATCALLEMITTLADEVAFVWPARWTPMKIIFLVNKYMTFGDIIMAIILGSADVQPSESLCSTRFRLLSYWYFIGMALSELILVARTAALWGFNKYVTSYLVIGTLQTIPEACYAVYQMTLSPRFADDGLPTGLQVGCFWEVNTREAWPAFFLLVASEAIVIVLTLVKRYVDPVIPLEDSNCNRLQKTLYRDGTVFWLVVLAFSVANFVVMFAAPQELCAIVQMPLRVVHSSLCTRVLLNLRKAAASACPSSLDDFTMRTTLAFTHPPDLELCDAEPLHELMDSADRA